MLKQCSDCAAATTTATDIISVDTDIIIIISIIRIIRETNRREKRLLFGVMITLVEHTGTIAANAAAAVAPECLRFCEVSVESRGIS